MDATRKRTAAARLMPALLALVAAGCGEREAAVAPGGPAPPATVAIAATAPTPAATASIAPATAATVAAAAAPALSLALDPEGLRVFIEGTGESRLLAFGAAQADVAARLARVLPEPQQAYPDSEFCGAMIRLPRSGLNVYFRDGEFAGWGIDDASRLTTVAGIGMGSTRKALEAVAVTKMFAESTLDHEFDAGGISGTFASGAKDTKITGLWAGDACIMR